MYIYTTFTKQPFEESSAVDSIIPYGLELFIW